MFIKTFKTKYIYKFQTKYKKYIIFKNKSPENKQNIGNTLRIQKQIFEEKIQHNKKNNIITFSGFFWTNNRDLDMYFYLSRSVKRKYPGKFPKKKRRKNKKIIHFWCFLLDIVFNFKCSIKIKTVPFTYVSGIYFSIIIKFPSRIQRKEVLEWGENIRIRKEKEKKIEKKVLE